MTKCNAALTQILSKAAVPSEQKDGTNESTKSNSHRLTISFTTVNSLSCLLDCCQNGIVRHRRLGNDVGGLGVQLNIEGFDTCRFQEKPFSISLLLRNTEGVHELCDIPQHHLTC